MRVRNVIVAALCLGVLGACGDDDKGGVSSSAKVSELTPAQWTSWCEENAATFAKDVQRAGCTLAGLAAKQAQQGTCETVRDQCTANDTDDGIDCKSAPVARDGGVTNCSATVGELQKCYDDLMAAIKPVLSGLTCSSNLLDLTSKMQSIATTQPASCKVIATKCADFAPSFGGED